jgi:hypothetical protein
MRAERPLVFTNIRAGIGIDEIVRFIEAAGFLSSEVEGGAARVAAM